MKKPVNKKLKYGSFAVAFTLVVLALIIVVNAIFTALAKHNSLYADMTAEQVYTISDEADVIFKQIGKQLKEDKKSLEIIFFVAKDKLRGNEQTNMVYEYAKKLDERYSFVSIDFIDPIENPTELRDRLPDVKKVLQTDIAISNGKEFRKLALEKFFVKDTQSDNYFAFDAEYKFSTTFLQLAYEKKLACFTTGHEEDTASANMKQLFEDASFDVVDIDLTKEDIPEEAKVIIINNPKRDFAKEDPGKKTADEIGKIETFLTSGKAQGNLMVFCSAENVDKIKNLNELLGNWGIRFTSDYVEDTTNTISYDYKSVIAKYSEEGQGGSLVKKLREAENPPKTIVDDPTAIEILWKTGVDGENSVSNVLTTYDTAVARSAKDNSIKRSGEEISLMTLSMSDVQDSEGTHYYNYVLAAGTSSFVDSEYINSNAYANADVIFETMRAFGVESVPIDLNFKVFDSRKLENLTYGQANTWTVIFTAGIPVLFLGTGLIIRMRRKHL
ncbi:MAG: hypothetical protein E7652_05370 [Ruminococcaceae bacterium]|nr:hypothetical protein [Oscillospiraceae bacterium]